MSFGVSSIINGCFTEKTVELSETEGGRKHSRFAYIIQLSQSLVKSKPYGFGEIQSTHRRRLISPTRKGGFRKKSTPKGAFLVRMTGLDLIIVLPPSRPAASRCPPDICI